MLDAWIVEKIKEKEKEAERPQIRLPVPEYPCAEDKNEVESEERGVLIININGDDDGKEEG